LLKLASPQSYCIANILAESGGGSSRRILPRFWHAWRACSSPQANPEAEIRGLRIVAGLYATMLPRQASYQPVAAIPQVSRVPLLGSGHTGPLVSKEMVWCSAKASCRGLKDQRVTEEPENTFWYATAHRWTVPIEVSNLVASCRKLVFPHQYSSAMDFRSSGLSCVRGGRPIRFPLRGRCESQPEPALGCSRARIRRKRKALGRAACRLSW
jgi:hypothetical protein